MIDCASFSSSIQEVKRLLNGVFSSAPEVASKHAMHPRALVSMIGNQTNPDLGYRDG